MQLFGSAVSIPKRPNRPTAGFRRKRREAIKHRWKSMFWKRGQRQATITVRTPHSARTQCTFRKRPRSSAHRPIPLAARIRSKPAYAQRLPHKRPRSPACNAHPARETDPSQGRLRGASARKRPRPPAPEGLVPWAAAECLLRGRAASAADEVVAKTSRQHASLGHEARRPRRHAG